VLITTSLISLNAMLNAQDIELLPIVLPLDGALEKPSPAAS
jgi:hypothetical protein